MAIKPIRNQKNKNPPFFSHEFVIQNHADIISCVAMVFVVGLMLQVSDKTQQLTWGSSGTRMSLPLCHLFTPTGRLGGWLGVVGGPRWCTVGRSIQKTIVASQWRPRVLLPRIQFWCVALTCPIPEARFVFLGGSSHVLFLSCRRPAPWQASLSPCSTTSPVPTRQPRIQGKC